ncbi:MAG: serine/threonine-protein kinase [Nannocystales bacterium]
MSKTPEYETDDALEDELRALLRVPRIDPEALLEQLAPSMLGPGVRIDDAFVIERRIAQGGMGVVYLARHELLNRSVAIKLCRRRATGPQTRRLLQEARTMAALDHPNVVQVHHVGMFDDQVYIAMEFVDGGTLTAWCAERPRLPAELIAAFVAAGRGLEAAHALEFVHRDFKPDNVLVGADGRVRVGDFGLAAANRVSVLEVDAATQTDDSASGVAGTPHYMAPEQRAGLRVGPAADQYALCFSLLEALDDAAKRRKAAGDKEEHVPRRVRAALERGILAEPQDRHADVSALLKVLQARRPWSSSRGLAGVLGLVGLTSSLAWCAAAPPTVECPSSSQRMATVWSPHRQRAVLDSVPRQESRRLLSEGLDRFAHRWSQAHARTCDASEFPTSALRNASRACLHEASAHFDTTLEALLDPDGDVRVMQGLYALPNLQPCLDIATLQRRLTHQRKPGDADRAAELRVELARIRAGVQFAGQRSNVGRIDAAIRGARTLEDRSILALALLLRARAADDGPSNAVEWLERGFFEAEAAGDDRLRAEIGTQLVYFLGVVRGRHHDALAWASRTEAVVARLGDAGAAEAGALFDSLGWVHLEHGQLEEATSALQRAETLKVAALGSEHPSTSATRLALGRTWLRRRRYALAREALAAAYNGYTHAGDLRHPGIARTQLLLAELAEERADDREAVRMFRAVLERWEVEFGLHHPRLILPLNSLGRVKARVGDFDEAISAYRRARALAERSLGPDDVQTGWALGNEAEGLLAAGAYVPALQVFDAAVTHMSAQPSPLGGLLTEALSGRAEASLALGRFRAVLQDAEQVIDTCETAPCEPAILARARFARGRALRALGRHAQALAQVRVALTELPDGRRTQRTLRRAIEQWLARHGP